MNWKCLNYALGKVDGFQSTCKICLVKSNFHNVQFSNRSVKKWAQVALGFQRYLKCFRQHLHRLPKRVEEVTPIWSSWARIGINFCHSNQKKLHFYFGSAMNQTVRSVVVPLLCWANSRKWCLRNTTIVATIKVIRFHRNNSHLLSNIGQRLSSVHHPHLLSSKANFPSLAARLLIVR